MVAWWAPPMVGGGAALVGTALAGDGTFAGLVTILVARFVLTLGSYGTGAPGGIFAPLLVLGSQSGLALGLVVAAVAPPLVGEPRAWAVVGMAALFSGSVRAPLTGIVLMLEMTETYTLMLPLLVASFAAHWVADRLGAAPIYDSLLEREIGRSGEVEAADGALMVELDVFPDAPFAGRRVAELGLPRGCLIVALERSSRHLVVTAETELRPGDRLHVVLAPAAQAAIGDLRVGLGIDRHA